MSDLGKQIKEIRLSKGLTMVDFGKLIDNTPQSLVSRWERGINKPNKKRLKMIADITNIKVDDLLIGDKLDDIIKQPSHYVRNGVEVDDVIDAFELNYRMGNVVKYVCRYKFKGNPLMDLKKAYEYLGREIAKLEALEDEPMGCEGSE